MNSVFDVDENKLLKKQHKIRNLIIVIAIVFLAVFVLDLVFMTRKNVVYHIVFGLVIALVASVVLVHLFFTTYRKTHSYLLLKRNEKLSGASRLVKCLEVSPDDYLRDHITFKRVKFLTENKETIELDVYVGKVNEFILNKKYLISSFNSILYKYKEKNNDGK